MPAPRAHADDVTMSTGGYDLLATVGAKHSIDGAIPLVLSALEQMELPGDGRPFIMTDMGCADGGTSLEMVRSVVAGLRARSPDLPIQVLYADQPGNDYNTLARITYGLSDFDSYYDKFNELYLAFSATTFYRQIVPAGVLNLGFSATAMHWLSRKPIDITDHVHAVGASGTELEAFQKQAAADLETILMNRARELASGGRLILINFCRDAEGRYLGNTGGVNMHDTFNAIWREHVDEGTISEEEYVRMTLPQYYNSLEEFRRPFESPDSPVPRSGLRLDHLESRVVRCPFAEEFRQHGDAAKFARDYVPTLRTWTESTFFAALAASRSRADRTEIIDGYYDRYVARVAREPEGHAMDYVHAYMVISKE